MVTFAGINPLLNSYLQNGHWAGFHTHHITHLLEALEKVLPQGYDILTEESLQIRRIQPDEGLETLHATKPDVLVVKTGSSPTMGVAEYTPPSSTLYLADLEDKEEETSAALIIYQVDESKLGGKAVTRIELLSPANKPGGSHFSLYKDKRLDTLKSGINLVELDYLHESRPILPKLKSYPDGEQGAFPYYVMVSRPSPTYVQGIADIYGFGVEDPLPKILLPLATNEQIVFDLNLPYQHSSGFTRRFRQVTRRNELPVHFERYTPEDQMRIRQRLATS
jgi:Protein of unknown function (DUF4058)